MNGRDDRAPVTGGDPYVTWDAAYVLGALSKTERNEFEGHLRSCATCDRAVGELAGMPALLGRLDADDIQSIEESGQVAGETAEPPPELLTTLVATVRRRRRARMVAWTGGMAAAAAVAIGVLVVVRPHAVAPVAPVPAPQAAAPLTMTPVEPSPLTATVSLVSHTWGTGIEMNCTYGAEPEGDDGDVDKLSMVAVGRDGSRTQLATWVAHTGVVASPMGSTSMPINQIAAIQVVSAETGDVLLQRDS